MDTPKKSKKITLSITGIIILSILLVGAFSLGKMTEQKSHATTDVSLPDAKAKENINKSFLFSVKNDSDIEITKIKYVIKSTEIQQSIIVKGQMATAIKGKTFLIIDITLTNDFNKNIQINSRDYVRLTTSTPQETLAPDLYNDPIEVDAISSKDTRLGFAINQNEKRLILHVGEIDGSKTDIPLKITAN